MNRELNPSLFGPMWSPPAAPASQAQANPGFSTGASYAGTPYMGVDGAGAMAAQPRVPYLSNELKALEHQLNLLKLALNQMEKRSEMLNSKMEDLGRNVHGRLERFSQAIGKVEEVQKKNHHDHLERCSQLSVRVNERKVTDQKIQELLDRHNTIVRNFENRLTNLQRINTEQELALHGAQAALEEMRVEITRRR